MPAKCVTPTSEPPLTWPEDSQWKPKMDWARYRMVRDNPFFASCLLNLRVEKSLAVPTMATNGLEILYNPWFVAGMTREQTLGVLAHEILHVVGLHMIRRQHRHMKGWNWACDAAINGLLVDNKFVLPHGCVEPIRGKTPEQIYDELPNEDKTNGGDGDFTIGEVTDATDGNGDPVSSAGAKELADKVTSITVRAALRAQQAGKVPAGMERLVEELLEPLIPWRDVLARFISAKAANDWSWQRPNRRYQQSGLYLPSPDGTRLAKGAVACDTSGSMDQEQLREVCSELLGLCEMFDADEDPSLDVIWFDHAACHQTVATASDLRPVGGGGTSFRVAFEQISVLSLRPAWLVMLTDGYCDDYGPDPGYPVLWILTKGRRPEFKPPFGEVAHYM